MTRKTESHPHFPHAVGSIFCTENGDIGSISCTPSTPINGTIYYISVGTGERTKTVGGSHGPAAVLAFPLRRQREKVADVARKLAKTTTRRHASYYRQQVTKALDGKLCRLGVCVDHRKRELALFWQAVACVMERQRRHGGAA